MSREVIAAIFNSHKDAIRATEKIREEGLRMDDISILTQSDVEQQNKNDGRPSHDNVSDGTMRGGVLGGLAGLFLGLGTIAVPGLGVVAAAGPIAGLLSGAITGGVVGALVDLGIPDERAQEFHEDLRHGKVLWSMETEEEYAEHVKSILREYGAEKV